MIDLNSVFVDTSLRGRIYRNPRTLMRLCRYAASKNVWNFSRVPLDKIAWVMVDGGKSSHWIVVKYPSSHVLSGYPLSMSESLTEKIQFPFQWYRFINKRVGYIVQVRFAINWPCMIEDKRVVVIDVPQCYVMMPKPMGEELGWYREW